MRRGRANERGAALLVVMVAVAVLTALAVELAYDTRVSLRIAANARDDLKAAYQARGGVALSRLVLSFQKDIDAALRGPGGAGARGARGAATAGLQLPRPQLWRAIPVTSALAGSLFGGERIPAPAPEGAAGAAAEGFEVAIDDEGRKVNVQLDALDNNPLLRAQVQSLFHLICDPRWDALFDREDQFGVRVSRADLLVYLRDWVDRGEEGAALAASFPPGTCEIVTPLNPFERGYQDENHPYDRGPDRYRAKNARMDSLAELYMVAGIGDAFMAAFGDAITVYVPRDAAQSVNETEPAGLLILARSFAADQLDPNLRKPEFLPLLHTLVMQETFGGILALAPSRLADLIEQAGVTVNPTLRPLLAKIGDPNNPFTDRSTAFRIRSLGRSGDVTKTIDAVVWFNEQQTQQQSGVATPNTTPGRVVHWREE